MTTSPEDGMRIIGRGEAAGIAMAKHREGTLASNNLRDIRIDAGKAFDWGRTSEEYAK